MAIQHTTSAPAPLPRILVADDERINLLAISSALSGEFEVVEAKTGAEVLERAAAGDIDLILLDVVMPVLDGFQVCRRLKSNPSTAKIPVIFVTGLDDSAEESQGFSAGAVDYITKPIRAATLRARVRAHVELKRSRDLFEQQASVDPLTGVANRRRFDAAIAEEWRRCRRASRWLSLAIVDVDHFKQFNDRYGHQAGDGCLQAIAASLVSNVRRAGELVGRYGGEEFGLILPDVDTAMMHGMVRTLVNSTTAAGGDVVSIPREPVTVSVGAISVVPSRDEGETKALAATDALLYEAKAGGRARGVHLDFSTQRKVIITRER
jgi:diguanylate cyclase (GGDEF)-like protein